MLTRGQFTKRSLLAVLTPFLPSSLFKTAPRAAPYICPPYVPPTFTVATGQGAYFRIGDIIRNTATNEAMRVTAISGDGITAIRGIGAAKEQPIEPNSDIFIVGNASPVEAKVQPSGNHFWTEDQLVPRIAQTA